MTDLVERLRAALDAEAQDIELSISNEIEGLRADGGIVMTREEILAFDAEEEGGGPYTRRLRAVAAHRKILDLHEPTIKIRDLYDRRNGLRTGEQRTDYHCGTCGGRDWDLDPIGDKPCRTLLALAEAYGVEA